MKAKTATITLGAYEVKVREVIERAFVIPATSYKEARAIFESTAIGDFEESEYEVVERTVVRVRQPSGDTNNESARQS